MSKPLRSTASVSMLGLVLVVFAACEQIENPGKVTPGTPQVNETRSDELQRNQFEDVPVPRDMQLVTRANQSFGYAAAGVRVGRYLYRGALAPEQVVGFLRENMPISAYGWTPASESVDGPVARLVYQKGADRCVLDVRREDGATSLLVMVNYETVK